MTARENYARYANGNGLWSDIQAHLPRLRHYAHGQVLGIGVRAGISTAALLVGVAERQGHVWSVDLTDCGALYDDPRWTFIQGHSVHDAHQIVERLPPALDVLFLDSDHTFETTSYELQLYAPLVKRHGGVILLHDSDLQGSGVRQALDQFAKEISKPVLYHSGSFGLGELRP